MENEVKEPAPKYNYISPEEYLAMERTSDVKHEYYKGQVYAMSGASWEHNVISFNINRLIAPFLHLKGCKLFNSDFRVHIPDNTLFTYPDFTIVCGDYQSSLKYADNLTTPSVIIEILSKSTRDYDRGTKFSLYRSIKTLKEYILIDSESVHAEFFTRQADNSWTLKESKDLSDTISITVINFSITLRDIYEDVRLSND